MRKTLRVMAAFCLMAFTAFAQDAKTMTPQSYWLPARATNHPVPVRIDELFNLIMYITAATLAGVLLLMVIFLVKYRAKPGQRAKYTHGNHTLEVVWTIVPACILVWLAVTQLDTWGDAKVPKRFPTAAESTVVRVGAWQFEWNFRMAGLDGKFETYNDAKAAADAANNAENPGHLAKPTADKYFNKEDDDDVVSRGTLTVPVGKPVLIELRSTDVIHSFYIPTMRLKQDAVPGKPMMLWFRPDYVGKFEIACAELCGLGHTTMRATLNVLPQAEFDKWYAEESKKGFGTVDRQDPKDIFKFWPNQDADRPWEKYKMVATETAGEHK